MLEINNLTKIYDGNPKPSVDNLSLSVSDGEIFGFIGPNGAGKSTTIKAISGIIDFNDGNVLIDGIDIAQNPIEAKKLLGYVSDDHVLYEGLTGIEYINFICDVFDVPLAFRAQRLEKYAELFSLQNVLKKQIATYSHGMKQKLNIIGALIHEPRVWILDEPMTGLDPRSAYNLKQLMREHADKGNCVFFSSHVLDVVEKVCDRIGIIDDGHLIACCALEELKERNKDNSLEELFLKVTDGSQSDIYAQYLASKSDDSAQFDGRDEVFPELADDINGINGGSERLENDNEATEGNSEVAESQNKNESNNKSNNEGVEENE